MSVTTVKFTETDSMGQPASTIGWINTLIMLFPRWKRSTVAFCASVVGAFLTGHALGVVLNALMVGAYMFTGSMFLVWIIYIVGLLAIMYLGSKVGKLVHDAVMDDAVGKKMEAIASSAKDKITSWFSKSKTPVTS